MNKKILITGASGFIGTNLLEYYLGLGWEVLNLDICAPRNPKHSAYWRKVDLLDLAILTEVVEDFAPDYLVHLAARTDLEEKGNILGYDANIQGVKNLIIAANATPNISRIIFSSSMLVCKFGNIPRNSTDYSPDTLYGFSKVESEKHIRSANINTEWLIVRPTSIWGPWFAEPYLSFFKFVRSGLFFKPGKRAGIATFGYVGNAVYQIHCLLCTPNEKVEHKTFYIGDSDPYDLSVWADKIAAFYGRKVIYCPYLLLKCAAVLGDFLQLIKIPFPLNSFRLGNMTTNNILDTSATQAVASRPPYSLNEGIKETVEWISKHEKVDRRQ